MLHPTGPDCWEGTPTWVTKEDRIAEERALAAVETFWKQFAQRYRGRSVIFAYDLKNEPKVPWDSSAVRIKWNAWLETRYGTADKTAQAWGIAPESIRWGQQLPPEARYDSIAGDRRLLDYQHFREGLADEWTRRQAEAIHAADPKALVTVGLLQSSVPAFASQPG